VSGLNTSGPSKSLQSVTMRRKRADSSSWNLGSTDSLSTAISTTSTSDGSNNDAVYVFKNEMPSSSPQTSALTMSSDSDSSSVSSSSASADSDSDSSSSSDDHISISTVSFVRQNSICSCTQVGIARSISHSADCRRSLFFSNFCLHNSVDLEEKEDSSSLPGDRDATTWTKGDSLALLGQGRVRI